MYLDYTHCALNLTYHHRSSHIHYSYQRKRARREETAESSYKKRLVEFLQKLFYFVLNLFLSHCKLTVATRWRGIDEIPLLSSPFIMMTSSSSSTTSSSPSSIWSVIVSRRETHRTWSSPLSDDFSTLLVVCSGCDQIRLAGWTMATSCPRGWAEKIRKMGKLSPMRRVNIPTTNKWIQSMGILCCSSPFIGHTSSSTLFTSQPQHPIFASPSTVSAVSEFLIEEERWFLQRIYVTMWIRRQRVN